MKTLIATIAIGLSLVVHAAPQNNDSSKALPTIDQLLKKYIRAIGGREAHEKLKTRIATGEWDNVTRGVRFPIEIYSKAPNKRVEILDASENRGFTGRGYDGTNGWSMNMTETGLRPLEGAELAMMKRESDFYRALRLDQLYKRLTLTAKENIDGREVYIVEALPETGNPEKLYFEAASGLLFRRDVVYGKTPVHHYFEDYKDIDGIKLPFTLRSEGPIKIVTRLREVKHNTTIDDAKFKIPIPN
jgi:outer membrane lipoprotein-sorting protein